MNAKDASKFKKFVIENMSYVRNLIAVGSGRSVCAKQENWKTVTYFLGQAKVSTSTNNVAPAAKIIGDALGRPVEVVQPPEEINVAGMLKTLEAESSDVRRMVGAVSVRLDLNQLKHQHKDAPIGTRRKGGGNRFTDVATAQWHRKTTLLHMGRWAQKLPSMSEGVKVQHGQAKAVNGIHYEGYCLLAGGAKCVLFHCYPADGSELKAGG